ncbi:hypothetical protein L1049_011735 [Liquidambar formosana]|uniref:Gag-Pol polyprotein/retrotransposon n=1 Tax=Liquidambar formosana TaxID=63359 RepID=A0AAP0RXR6_LIQFO
MALPLRISGYRAHLSHHQGFCEFFPMSIPSVYTRFHLHKLKNSSVLHYHFKGCFCSTNGDANVVGVSDDDNYSADHEGLKEKNESHQAESLSSNEILTRLRRYGISGILAYGLLNTAYYLTTFLLVWFYVSPAPGRMGYFAAVKRFLKLMAMVWAGSQVTKLARAGGALALAPFVDRGLSWFTVKFKFESQGKAFLAIVGLCFGLALIIFFAVTLLWA